MKIFNALAASATLLLLATLPAVGQSTAPRASGASVQLSAESDFGVKRDEYVRRSKAAMEEWRLKIHDFGQTAEAKGHDASADAKAGLQSAWQKTEAESRRLETASANEWENAKSSFEHASQDLKDRWHRIHPEGE